MLWLGASVPVLSNLSLYALALRARLHLGHWPYPYHPDPKDLPFPVHYALQWILLFLAFYSGIALVAAIANPANKGIQRGAAACVASCGLWFLLALSDPGHLYEWFFD